MKDLKHMFKVAVESEIGVLGDYDTGTAPISEDAFARAITESETSLDSVMDAHDDVEAAYDDFDTVAEASGHIDETFQVAVESIAAGANYAVVRPMAVANLRYAFRRIGLEGDINSDAAEGEPHGVETPKEAEPHVDGVECTSDICPECGGASVESLGDKAKAFAETVIKALKVVWEKIKEFYNKYLTHLGLIITYAEFGIKRIDSLKGTGGTVRKEITIVKPVGADIIEAVDALLENASSLDAKTTPEAMVAKYGHLKVDTATTSVSFTLPSLKSALQNEIAGIKKVQDIRSVIAKIDTNFNNVSGAATISKRLKMIDGDTHAEMMKHISAMKEQMALATRLSREVVTNISKRVRTMVTATKQFK